MNTVLWSLMTLAAIAAVVVFTLVMLEVRTAVRSLKELIKTVDSSCAPIKPAIEELQLTLQSVRNVTDNVNGVAEDVRELSSSIRDVGEKVKYVTDIVGGVTSVTTGRVSALRSGINAAIEVVMRSIFGRNR